MIEIIPNWHPFVVHFTIALIIVSAALHVLLGLGLFSGQHQALSNVANWNLWLGAVFAVLAVLAGMDAYNTVDHDTPSHLAMTDHRNWALSTLVVCLIAAIFSAIHARKQQNIHPGSTVLVVIAAVLIMVTGFKGGELVYRHGLGVMSLPKSDSHGHAVGESHDHGSAGQSPDHQGNAHESLDEANEHDDAGHAHDSAGMHEHPGIENTRDHGQQESESSKTHEHADGSKHQH